ncbi:MAG TPA: hypothetical protein VGO37_19020 [Steroidobacteraceae bacterium]|nr:hypothetical protein [Steroidobacteraceae bacterium]
MVDAVILPPIIDTVGALTLISPAATVPLVDACSELPTNPIAPFEDERDIFPGANPVAAVVATEVSNATFSMLKSRFADTVIFPAWPAFASANVTIDVDNDPLGTLPSTIDPWLAVMLMSPALPAPALALELSCVPTI